MTNNVTIPRANLRLLLMALMASALPSWAQSALTCSASMTQASLRKESVAELLGDLILDCKGGASAGERLEILIASNVPITSRDLPSTINPTWGFVDALLLVDDPEPSRQVPCVFAAGASACSSSGSNVFQGRRIQENMIAFQSVALSQPDDRGARRLRIVNLRGDVTKLTEAASQVKVNVLMFSNGRAVPTDRDTFTLDPPEAACQFSLRTDTGEEVSPKQPALVVPRNQLPTWRPEPLRGFLLKFTEGTKHGLRRRNFGSNAGDATMTISQDVPGVAYGTESGFYNARFPDTNGLSVAGRADFGDRLRVQFTGVPKGVGIWVTARDLAPTAGAAPRALLTYTDGARISEFARVFPELGDYAQLYVDNGTTTATWEIVSADPEVVESLVFSVAIVALEGAPDLGIASVTASLLPAAVASVAPPTQRPIYPQFAQAESDPTVAFQVVNSFALPTVTVLPSASLKGAAVAPDSVASVFGTDLPAAPTAAPGAPVASLDNVSVVLLDAIGVRRDALLFAASPSQLNVLVAGETRQGPAVIQVIRGGAVIATGFTTVERVAPGIFTASGSGSGPPVGEIGRAPGPLGSGLPLALLDAAATWQPATIDLGASGDAAYLTLLGSGMRNGATFTARIGAATVPVLGVEKASEIPGVDRARVGPLPPSLNGAGQVDLVITVDGKAANAVTLRFK
jgi:uncharacterized protein (TIGR03437 family)